MVEKLYVCSTCREYARNFAGMFMDWDERVVKEHEKIPIKEGSIDGLILQESENRYRVFRKTEHITRQHERLYGYGIILLGAWDCNLIGPSGHETEEEILACLMPLTRETTAKEFDKLTKLLRKEYPEVYGDIEFKRTVEQLALYIS